MRFPEVTGKDARVRHTHDGTVPAHDTYCLVDGIRLRCAHFGRRVRFAGFNHFRNSVFTLGPEQDDVAFLAIVPFKVGVFEEQLESGFVSGLRFAVLFPLVIRKVLPRIPCGFIVPNLRIPPPVRGDSCTAFVWIRV